MENTGFREIPWNYTSADDERVVSILFGTDVWESLERLRAQRVTGRSAKYLARFFGDLFLVRRNPFLYQDLVASRSRRRDFLAKARTELDTVEAQADGHAEVLSVLARCRAAWKELAGELAWAGLRQRRIRAVLGAVVGPANVCFDPFSLVSHATDATDWRLHLPLCVTFPTEERQVAPLLAAIARLKLKALPRGAGTGLTGGAVPVAPDCVVVNSERLDRIRGVKTVEDPLPDGAPRTLEVLEVEAGVITEDAITYAEERHRVFATDPTSAWASSIGGNIAENAGGKMAVLWGTAIDNLWSWRIAMPGNKVREVRRLGHPLRKILFDDAVRFEVRDEAGAVLQTISLTGDEVRKRGLWKDITNKALGGVPGLQKEGTDGVITSARFVLHRPYPQKATFCLEFFGDDNREASTIILALSDAFPDRGEETLLALEHFDEEYVEAIGYRTKCDRGGRPRAVLLIDMVAHTPEQLARGVDRMQALLKPHGNTCLFTAADAAEAERFWADRKKLGAIARRTNAFKLNEDVVLPLPRLEAFAEYIADYNVAEERHNHRQLADRLRAYLETAVADRADAWITPKMARAAELLDRAVAESEASSRKDLRDGVVVDRLRDGLLELFAGYGDVAEGIRSLIAAQRARIIVLATHMHAGDGNVHVNIPVLSNDREMMRRAGDTADTVMRKVMEMGGVVSGEHGIGVTKLLHLEPERLEALAEYRRGVDPDDLMNPGKLSDRSVPGKVFTPSFNLLELEARILKHDSLEVLADKISKCVRCGKCKPPCSTFHPGQGMFYHPRNKNLAIGAVVEALLYDAQRTHSTRFEALKYLEEVADHCTLCHRCLKPCPVDIDTAEVSLLERQILRARKYKHTPVAVRLSLFYLLSKSKVFNAVFRRVVLSWGTAVQRLGARLMALVPDVRGFKARGPFALLRSPMAKPAPAPLHRALPAQTRSQALLVRPDGEPKRTVFYFPGCGSERLHTDVSKAALYVLLKTGTQVVMPPPFLCCGFPHMANARDRQQGRQVLQDTIIFSQIREMLRYLDFQALVVTCGTCMEGLRGMGADAVFGTRLVDAGRFALENGLALPSPEGGDALYHKPCHDSMEGKGVEVLRLKAGVRALDVPHCCSEAGTLPLSRPDIAWNMLDRKALGIRSAMEGRPKGTPMLTHCPSCLSGLSRNARLGIRPVHVTVHLAERLGGPRWREELQPLLDRAEAVPF
jgi:FAD/FMN-containing dehydrogenase/Fe-S oxidoreductase